MDWLISQSLLQGLVTLFGGLGLFLLGMNLLTDGLKLAAGQALEQLLVAWTRTRWHGLVTGFAITALVQSSSAMTVAVIGFVNAGLLGFAPALWVVFGANVGSTVTGWIVALIGFKVKVDALALPCIGIGMALRLTGSHTRRAATGSSLVGFGLLFLGIELMREGFSGLGPQALPALGDDARSLAMAVLAGLVITVLLQSSSASLTLVLAAVAGGGTPIIAGAALVIGANIGTTITAILAAMGATSNARRLAAAHVVFNLLTTMVALLALGPLLWLLQQLTQALTLPGDPVTLLVLFHTLFNVLGVLLMWPMAGGLARWLQRRFTTADEDQAHPRFLDRNALAVPALALQALRHEIERLVWLSFGMARMAVQAHPLAPGHVRLDGVRITQQWQTLERLQRAIARFVAELGVRALPATSASELPQLLRVAGYLDTLGRMAHGVGDWAVQQVPAQTSQPLPSASHLWRERLMPVLATAHACFAVQAVDKAQTPEPSEAQPVAITQAMRTAYGRAAEDFEQTYQTSKAKLLEDAALARLPVEPVYAALARLSDLRRAVAQAGKALNLLCSLSEAGASER